MIHFNTTLHQIASFIPRHGFEKLTQQYHGGQRLRPFNRWTQLMAMTVAQLTGRKNLRDLVGNLAVKGKNIYLLGIKSTGRGTLARVNEQQPNDLSRKSLFQLLKQCETKVPGHQFKFKGKNLPS